MSDCIFDKYYYADMFVAMYGKPKHDPIKTRHRLQKTILVYTYRVSFLPTRGRHPTTHCCPEVNLLTKWNQSKEIKWHLYTSDL